MVKLTNATPQKRYNLHLEYSDGVSGEVDLSDLAGRGVFTAWQNPGVFELVSIGTNGELRWSDELELCSDALYLKITGKTAEELFPNLRIVADA